MNEFELIRHYFTFSADDQGAVALGVGDDCALLRVPEGHNLAVTTDTLVSGVHFPDYGRPDLIARRALRVNLSDLAAMGARPLGFQLALTLPAIDATWLAQFSAGLAGDAAAFNCPLCGGDTTRGPLSITITMMGAVADGGALRRSGARNGDLVCVSGPLGGAAGALAGLAELREGDNLFAPYWLPEPRLELGYLLSSVASAGLDISDGLVQDLGHIARASDLRAELDLAAVPVAASLQGSKPLTEARKLAATGGDDYELCFTLAPLHLQSLRHQAKPLGIEIFAIGRILPADSTLPVVSCIDEQGRSVELGATGYDHFGG